MKRNHRLVVALAILISLPCVTAFAGKNKKSSPWDCVRDGLAKLLPLRIPIEEAARRLEAALSERPAIKGVTPDSTESVLIVHAATADELLRTEATYSRGFWGYAIMTELGLEHPRESRQIYATGDPRNMAWYLESLAVDLNPTGVELKKNGKQVPFDEKRRVTPEHKLSVELRAQLASDYLRHASGYNPDRKILVAVQPSRLHWDYLEKQYSEGVGIPHESDLKEAAPRVLREFAKRHETNGRATVHDFKEIFGGSSYYVLITVPAFSELLQALADENVSTADIAENFD